MSNPVTAVLATSASSLDDAQQKSEGVWHAAWRRFKADRVGLASLVVVVAFIVLIALSAVGIVAKNWQAEVGVANAPPTLLGPRPPEATGTVAVPKGPNVDLSAMHGKKAGTPTMGGLLILVALLVSVKLFCRLTSLYVLTLMAMTFGYGALGFWDD